MTDIEKEPSIGISYSVAMPNNRQLVLQSFVARDSTDLDGTLDKLRKAGERQFAFFALEAAKLQLQQEEKLARDHAARMAQVEKNIHAAWENGSRKGNVVLSKTERDQQAQAVAHAEECKVRIAKVKKDIADFQAIIGA